MSQRNSNMVFRVLDAKNKIVGMGLILTPDLGITNLHVVKLTQPDLEDALKILIGDKFLDGYIDKNHLDEINDLAFIKIQLPGINPPKLTHTQKCNGQKVYAYGFNNNREIIAEGTIRGNIIDEQNRNLLQIDSAEITVGFSGSPVFTENGDIVGIICEILAPDTFGRLDRVAYAIPSETIAMVHPAVGLSNSVGLESSIFQALIDDKTKNFIGREFLLAEIDTFIKTQESGYFMLTGVPGIGKTSFIAHLVKERGYIHHFNVASQNIRGGNFFVESVCSQIISKYNLPLEKPSNLDHSGILLQTLYDASKKINLDTPIIIVVDALDEADRQNLSSSVNILYLPESLPRNVYFILSSRPIYDYRLSVANLYRYELQSNGRENLDDISNFIKIYLKRPAIQAQITKWDTNEKDFSSALTEKSQGNFMYLRHILPALETGLYDFQTIADLPSGLLAYYQRHWRQMTDLPKEEFEKIYEPVVCILGVVNEAVSISQIANWTKISEWQVKQAIQYWFEFLEEDISQNAKQYRIYHRSFQDFLKEQVDLRKYDGLIANYYETLIGG